MEQLKASKIEIKQPQSPSDSLDSGFRNEVPPDDNSSSSSDHEEVAEQEEPGRRSPLLFCLGNNAKRIQSRMRYEFFLYKCNILGRGKFHQLT